MFSTPVENLWIKGDIAHKKQIKKVLKCIVTQRKTIVEHFSVFIVEKCPGISFFEIFLSYPHGKACG